MNDYSRVTKYHCTTFSHDHRTSHLEGLTITWRKAFISHWIRPLRGPVLIILFYNLSPYLPYSKTPLLSVDHLRAQETHKTEQDVQHHSFWCMINYAMMPIAWCTRNRRNPGNRTVDGFWGMGTSPQGIGPLINDNLRFDQLQPILMLAHGAFLFSCPAAPCNPLNKWKPYRNNIYPASDRLRLDFGLLLVINFIYFKLLSPV